MMLFKIVQVGFILAFYCVFINILHVAACDPSCNTGLMRCTGRLSSDCCAAYNSTGYCVPPSKISDCIDDINLFNSTACRKYYTSFHVNY